MIVSDLPTPAGAFGPEDKMDAYLNRCEAVLVLATPDDQVGEAYQPRPNISDEIGRARSRETLRRRICVLKEPSVRLHSNIDAVYERLDPNDLTPAIMALLRQLTEWG